MGDTTERKQKQKQSNEEPTKAPSAVDSFSGIVKTFERIPTGIAGMDQILKGGILKGGTYLLMGPPGSGKTILANQMAFNYAAQGGGALYVTMLAESHGRLFGNMKPFGFFDESAISNQINYISAYQILEKEGLDGLIRSLAQLVRKNRAGLLFIDGVASIEGLSKTPVSFKKFVHDLNTVLSTSGCTAFLLSSLDGSVANPEHTMVDGIFSITFFNDGMRTIREIEVVKFRGSAHLTGKHSCRINEQGMSVFPRVELIMGRNPYETPEKNSGELCSFGIEKLDSMLGGGVQTGATTALLGAAGTGKTWLGNRFLEAGAEAGEPGLYLGFYEAPERLQRKMKRMGTDLTPHVRNGLIEYLWQAPLEYLTDEVALRLFDTLRRQKTKRLFIDGVGGFDKGMIDHRRLDGVLTAIMNELRRMEIAVLFTEETKLFPVEAETPISDQSALTDNIIYLRHIDLAGKLRRVLSVIKTRETPSSPEILEMTLSDEGMTIDGPILNADGLFTGTPRLHEEKVRVMKQKKTNSSKASKASKPPKSRTTRTGRGKGKKA